MYSGLLHSHSGLRWIVLLGIILTIVKCIPGLSGSKEWTHREARLANLTVRLLHVQVLIGLILYFMSPKVQFSGSTMSNDLLRFFTVEHTVMMLIAVVLITIGNAKSKKREGMAAYKSVFWFFLIALLIIIASIPWPIREQLGGSWF